MKRALALSLTAVLGLPLLADEPKNAGQKSAATPAATTTDAATTAAESPLVAAARRSKKRRAAGKTNVITNETLKNSKGHVSTAHTARPPLNVPEPAPGPEQTLAIAKAKAAAEAKAQEAARTEEQRKADAERERKRAAAATIAEEGVYEALESDPAVGEATADDATQAEKPPAD